MSQWHSKLTKDNMLKGWNRRIDSQAINIRWSGTYFPLAENAVVRYSPLDLPPNPNNSYDSGRLPVDSPRRISCWCAFTFLGTGHMSPMLIWWTIPATKARIQRW